MGAQLLTTIDREGHGLDAHTHTLIRSDSYEGSNDFRDDGHTSFPVHTSGTPYHSELTSVFGGSSIRFDGSSYIYMPYMAECDFDSTMNFTIDFWIMWDNVSVLQVIMEQFVGQSGPGWTMYTNSGTLVIYSLGAFVSVASCFTISNIWYHIAWSQKAGVGSKIFRNGIEIYSGVGSFPTATGGSSEALSIGARDDPGSKYWFIGNMDEIRFSDTIRWWTAPFSANLPRTKMDYVG